MGVEPRYPVVRATDPDGPEFPIYSVDGLVVSRTGHANVMCFLPARPGRPAWCRRPPFPPHWETHQFVNAAEVELIPRDYPVPHGHAFDRSRFVLADFGADQGWRNDTRLRYVADLTGDGRGDLVGFADDGVWVALGNGAGGFDAPTRVLEAFARDAGGWDLVAHPRFVADVTGDRCSDLVGFGEDGVWVALGDGVGRFGPPSFVLADFGRTGGGWDSTRHLRVPADLTGDGRADIVGFGEDSVWVALADGAGGFGPTRRGVPGFAFQDGWRTDVHVRTLADLTGDGRLDIVGFGDDGVWVALNDGAGGFGDMRFVLQEYGVAQGWTVATRPRLVADMTGDGRADLLGFREDGLLVARGDGAGGFGTPELVLPFFGSATGHVPWDPVLHPRLVADLTGNGAADLVGFADDGVWVLVFGTDGPLGPQLVITDFGTNQAWRSDVHLRVAADLTGVGRPDIVGFGDAGVYVSRNLGTGPSPRLVRTT
jgi:FG-GAP-like repeat